MVPNYAPYGTKNRMRALGAASLVLDLLILVLGFIFLHEGRHSPGFFITLGSVLLAVTLLTGAVARKQGKI